MRKVEDILLEWRHWNVGWSCPPRIERELAGGKTNQSYLITADNRRWVLRLNAFDATDFGIDRTREAAVIQCAVVADLAPAVAYCSPEDGILITEFIDGEHWQPQTLDNPEHLAQLLNLVRSVHSLDVDTATIDYFAHGEHYFAQLTAAKIKVPLTLHHERDQLLEQRERNPWRNQIAHLCHHDISPTNVIEFDGRLTLIDWEYAARGSRAFDYAGLATEWNLPLERLQTELGIGFTELSNAARLYQYICRLWALLTERHSIRRATYHDKPVDRITLL